MSLDGYLTEIKSVLAISALIQRINIKKERLIPPTLFIRIETELIDGSKLFIVEYVKRNDTMIRDKYKFHWQRNDDFTRWDNVPHHKEVDSFPHHKHLNDEVYSSKDMRLSDVLSDIELQLKTS